MLMSFQPHPSASAESRVRASYTLLCVRPFRVAPEVHVVRPRAWLEKFDLRHATCKCLTVVLTRGEHELSAAPLGVG